jgi:hypothetical protein
MQKLYAGALLAIAMPLAACHLTPAGCVSSSASTTLATYYCIPEIPGSSFELCFNNEANFDAYINGLFESDSHEEISVVKKSVLSVGEKKFVKNSMIEKPTVEKSTSEHSTSEHSTSEHSTSEYSAMGTSAPFVLLPLKDEGIKAFIERVAGDTSSRSSKKQSADVADSLFDAQLLQMPWYNLRYLFAVNVALGVLDPNAVFAASNLTPLDYAVQKSDEETALFLWEQGARNAKDCRTIGSLRTQIVMPSTDARSVAILKEMMQSRVHFYEWAEFGWAKKLSPKQVRDKMAILLRLQPDAAGVMQPQSCVPAYVLDALAHETPGEQALIEFVSQYADDKC